MLAADTQTKVCGLSFIREFLDGTLSSRRANLSAAEQMDLHSVDPEVLLGKLTLRDAPSAGKIFRAAVTNRNIRALMYLRQRGIGIPELSPNAWKLSSHFFEGVDYHYLAQLVTAPAEELATTDFRKVLIDGMRAELAVIGPETPQTMKLKQDLAELRESQRKSDLTSSLEFGQLWAQYMPAGFFESVDHRSSFFDERIEAYRELHEGYRSYAGTQGRQYDYALPAELMAPRKPVGLEYFLGIEDQKKAGLEKAFAFLEEQAERATNRKFANKCAAILEAREEITRKVLALAPKDALYEIALTRARLNWHGASMRLREKAAHGLGPAISYYEGLEG